MNHLPIKIPLLAGKMKNMDNEARMVAFRTRTAFMTRRRTSRPKQSTNSRTGFAAEYPSRRTKKAALITIMGFKDVSRDTYEDRRRKKRDDIYGFYYGYDSTLWK